MLYLDSGLKSANSLISPRFSLNDSEILNILLSGIQLGKLYNLIFSYTVFLVPIFNVSIHQGQYFWFCILSYIDINFYSKSFGQYFLEAGNNEQPFAGVIPHP